MWFGKSQMGNLIAFESAARHLSLTKAAQELNVTQSAISQKIKQLEDELNVVLFVRHGPRIGLTSESLKLSRSLRDAFVSIEQATHQFVRASQRPSVIVHAPISFVAQWLLGAFSQYTKAFPDLDIQIAPLRDGQKVERTAANGLYVSWEEPFHDSVTLVHDQLTMVAAPGMLQQLSPQDNVIKHRIEIASDQRAHDWNAFLSATFPPSSLAELGQQAPLRLDTTDAVQAAIEGRGALVCPKHLMWDAYASGKLVPCSPASVQSTEAYCIRFANSEMDEQTEKRNRNVVEWLVEHLRA